MTSAVGKEDIEAALWQSGIRTSHRVDGLMRLIEVYALEQVRKIHPLEDVPPVKDPYARLATGESDYGLEVTRCRSCEIVKDWKHFHADSGLKSGRKSTCKTCIREKQPPKMYKCRSCDEPRMLSEFPPEKAEKPTLPVNCLSCQEAKSLP